MDEQRQGVSSRFGPKSLKFRDITLNKLNISIREKTVPEIISYVAGDNDIPHSLCLCKNVSVKDAGLPRVH